MKTLVEQKFEIIEKDFENWNEYFGSLSSYSLLEQKYLFGENFEINKE